MPPYDPNQDDPRIEISAQPEEVSSLGVAAKMGLNLAMLGLGFGAYKSLRTAKRGALADARYFLEPLSIRLGKAGYNFRQAFSNFESTKVFSGGMLGGLNDALETIKAAPTNARPQIRDMFREHIEKNYLKPIDLHRNLPEGYDYLKVGDVLEEYGKLGPSNAKNIGEGRMVYDIFGRLMDETQLKSLKALSSTANPVVKSSDIIGRGIFVNKQQGSIVEAVTAGTIQKAAMQLFHFPLVGNPLDFIFKGKAPDFTRLSSKTMAQLGFEARRGFSIGEDLYQTTTTGAKKVGSGYDLYKSQSSQARAIASFTPEYSETKEAVGAFDLKKGKVSTGLAEEGFYDMPLVQAAAEKKIFGTSANDLLETWTGKRLNFSYRATNQAPDLARIDSWLQHRGLDFFSKRHALEPKTVYREGFDFLTRFRNTAPYAKTGEVTSGIWHPTRGHVIGEDQLDLFEKIKHKLGVDSSRYAHLTPDEASLVVGIDGTIDMHKLHTIRGTATGRKSNPFGTVTPNERQAIKNVSQGREIYANVAPEHIAYKKGLANDLKLKTAQGTQTTSRLLESMTGIGMKAMNPVAMMGIVSAGSVAAYMAWEGLHFFDYLIEKANPFGDFGVKKTALAAYGAVRVGQQAIMNYSVTPIAEGVDSVFPGVSDSFLGYAFRGLAGIAIGGAIGRKFSGPQFAKQGKDMRLAASMARTRASGVGAAIGGLAIGTSSALQDWSDLKDEYTGEKLVAVRENRWWGLGPQDFKGGDVTRMRKHWLAQEMQDERYKLYGGKGNYFLNVSPLTMVARTPLTAWTGLPGTDPYYTERLNYDTHPYPLTGKLFTDVPLVGPILAETLGEAIKPTKIMHGQAIRDLIKNRGKNDELRQIASDLGMETIAPGFSVPRKSNLLDAAGQSLDRLMDFWGMRGFLIGFAKKKITGTQDFFADGTRLQDATDLYSTSKIYFDMKIGGALGSTELLRRIMPGASRRDEINPAVETFYNDFDSSGGFKVYPGSPFMGGDSADSELIKSNASIPTNPSTGWNMGLKPSLPHIPYAFSKLYYRETPLQLYKDRVSIGDDFADWTNPVETMLLPYMRQAANRGIIDAATSGAALGVMGRDPYSAMVLGIAGAGAGVASSLLNGGEHSEKEARRREIEGYFDRIKFQKIENLSNVAKNMGRNDVMTRLEKLQSATMAGLNYGDTTERFIESAYLALPKSDRRFLVDFANAPKQYHEDIIDEVPNYMAPILQKIWADKQGDSTGRDIALNLANQSMSGASMPGPGWAGWRPDVSLNDIKLASVQFDGSDIHDYGFWGADERDVSRSRQYIKNLVTLPEMGAFGDDIIGLQSLMPINNMQISGRPTMGIMGDNQADVDIMYDRSSTLRKYQHRYSGRF